MVLKVDNRPVGRTHWRQLGTEAWGQSFSIELERVGVFRFNKQVKLRLSQNCFSFKRLLAQLSILMGKPGFGHNFHGRVE